MIGVNFLISSGAKQVFASLLIALIQIASIKIIYNALGANELGIYSFIIICLSIIQSFGDIGLSSYLLSVKNKTYNIYKSLLKISICSGFVTTLIYVVLLYGFSIYYLEGEIFHIGKWLFVSVFILSLSSLFQSILTKEGSSTVIPWIDSVARLIELAILALSVHTYGIYIIPITTLIYSLSRVVLLYIFVHRTIRRLDPGMIRKQENVNLIDYISFASYQLSTQLVNAVNSRLDELIIGKMFTTDILGLYSTVKGLLVKCTFLLTPVIRRLSLYYFYNMNAKSNVEFSKLSALLTVLLTIFFGFLISTSQYTIGWMLENISQEYIAIFNMLACIWLLRLLSTALISSYLVVLKKVKYELLFNILIFFVTIFIFSLNYYLEINRLNVIVLSYFIGYVVVRLLSCFCLSSVIRVRLKDGLILACVDTCIASLLFYKVMT